MKTQLSVLIADENKENALKMKTFFETRENMGNIEIAISSAPKDSSDEAYFIFNDYPIKTKGIIQVSVVHSNQVIADELIQHVGDFVSGIEDKRIKKDSFIYNHKREIAQSAEKILGIPALIPLVHLFFNINSCLNSTNSVIKLISICMGFFIL